MFNLLGGLFFTLIIRLLTFDRSRTELRIVRLLTLIHFLLDGFEALGNQAGAASDVAEHALQVFRPLLKGTEPGLQVLGAVTLDVFAHPILA